MRTSGVDACGIASAERLELATDARDLSFVADWRHTAAAFAGEPGSPHAAAVELVVDELVNNALVHAAPGYRLVVTPTGCGTVIEVHDGLPLASLALHDEPYRGLNVVSQLSCQALTFTATPTGKSIRAVVPVDAWNRQRCAE